MSYDLEKLVKLNAIKQLGERILRDFATSQSVADLAEKVNSSKPIKEVDHRTFTNFQDINDLSDNINNYEGIDDIFIFRNVTIKAVAFNPDTKNNEVRDILYNNVVVFVSTAMFSSTIGWKMTVMSLDGTVCQLNDKGSAHLPSSDVDFNLLSEYYFVKDSDLPTNLSDFTNDVGYQTASEVLTTVASAVAAANHLNYKKIASVDAIDLTATDADKYIYMVPITDGEGNNLYDEYMVIDGAIEHVGNTAIDLSDYIQKEEGKVLSSNDFTDEDKEKLEGIADDATKVAASTTKGNILINDEEVNVVEIASDEEIEEMLNSVFGEEDHG